MRKRQHGAIGKGLLQRGGGRRVESTVQRLARDISRTHALTAVPVAVLDCAASLQLPIIRAELTTDGGLVDWSTSACRILLPKQPPVLLGARRRERFTIAHEIGHFVIRRYLRETLPPRVFETHSAEEEYLCNLFAGELLVPAERLARDAERYGLTARGILALMDRYDVSLHVLGINLRHLFGTAIFLTTWAETDDGFIATSVAPGPKERVELVRSEGTTIHLAALTQKEESGVDSFYVGARLVRWQCWSIAIGLRRVLTVGLRADLWHRYTDQIQDGPTSTPVRSDPDVVPPGLVLQTSLPFEEGRGTQTATSHAKARRARRRGEPRRRSVPHR